MILLLKLIIAHLIGDFFLQPQSWVKEKEEKKLRSFKLYLHVLIHLVLMLIILWDSSKILLTISIATIHLLIDILKLILQNKSNKRLLFFIDQFLHIITLVIAYVIYTNTTPNLEAIFTSDNLLLITCLLFITKPVSIIMRTIFLKWNIEELTKGNESLEDAGKYIGVLERILVFIFIVVGHWEAVGFLITAKSVFRFGDLKESKHRKLTEYILIGTLISFGIAILTALIFLTIT